MNPEVAQAVIEAMKDLLNDPAISEAHNIKRLTLVINRHIAKYAPYIPAEQDPAPKTPSFDAALNFQNSKR